MHPVRLFMMGIDIPERGEIRESTAEDEDVELMRLLKDEYHVDVIGKLRKLYNLV